MLLQSVSCICPTFGRPWHLEEAIESFLRQDYKGPRELLILNDYADQVLKYKHNQVRLINNSEIKTIGEKRNILIESAQGEIIIVWDDDDISLPHRITQAVKYISKGMFFFRPDHSWYIADNNEPRLLKRQISWPQCAYTKTLWNKAGGYPQVLRGEDLEFAERVKAKGISTEFTKIPKKKAALIYRMWSSNPHASYGRSQKQIKQELFSKTPTGIIDLNPKWQIDYNMIVNELLIDHYQK